MVAAVPCSIKCEEPLLTDSTRREHPLPPDSHGLYSLTARPPLLTLPAQSASFPCAPRASARHTRIDLVHSVFP